MVKPVRDYDRGGRNTHSPARGLCELHMGWGLLEPLIHSHLGAIVTTVESLIKSHIQQHTEIKLSGVRMMAVDERL